MFTFLLHSLDSTTCPFDIGVLKKRLVQFEIISTTNGSGGHIEVYRSRLAPWVTQERLKGYCYFAEKQGVVGWFRRKLLNDSTQAPLLIHHFPAPQQAWVSTQVIHDGAV